MGLRSNDARGGVALCMDRLRPRTNRRPGRRTGRGFRERRVGSFLLLTTQRSSGRFRACYTIIKHVLPGHALTLWSRAFVTAARWHVQIVAGPATALSPRRHGVHLEAAIPSGYPKTTNPRICIRGLEEKGGWEAFYLSDESPGEKVPPTKRFFHIRASQPPNAVHTPRRHGWSAGRSRRHLPRCIIPPDFPPPEKKPRPVARPGH